MTLMTRSLPPAAHKTPTRAGEASPGWQDPAPIYGLIDQPRGRDTKDISFSSVKKVGRSGKHGSQGIELGLKTILGIS